jgi:hypothetical protein
MVRRSVNGEASRPEQSLALTGVAAFTDVTVGKAASGSRGTIAESSLTVAGRPGKSNVSDPGTINGDSLHKVPHSGIAGLATRKAPKREGITDADF